MLEGKVLITGGTGSLGTAILKRAQEENWPAEFSIVARNETKMNQVRSLYPHVRGEIGDIRDRDWMTTIFPGHDLILHTAALKIVPVAEPPRGVADKFDGVLLCSAGRHRVGG